MNIEKWFKYGVIGMFGVSFYLLLFPTPSSTLPPQLPAESAPTESAPTEEVTTTTVTGKNPLALAKIEQALQQAKDAEEFERALNSSEIRGENMDLDGDGKPDYIHVQERGEGDSKGFLLSLYHPDGRQEEIATISIRKQSEGNSSVQYQGQPAYFAGPSTSHSIWPSIGTGLILGYLWGNHQPYRSPYTYGHYPSSFRHVPPAHAPGAKPSSFSQKPSSPYKTPLQQSVRSQRSIQPKSPYRAPRKGGFGRRR